MKKKGLVLFAHGARDPGWAAPFVAIRNSVAKRRPDLAVDLAFLDIMSPRLAEAVERMAAGGVTDITIAPLFMAQGGHLKQDVPRLLADIGARQPGVALRLLPAVGEVNEILDAIGAWLVASVPLNDSGSS